MYACICSKEPSSGSLPESCRVRNPFGLTLSYGWIQSICICIGLYHATAAEGYCYEATPTGVYMYVIYVQVVGGGAGRVDIAVSICINQYACIHTYVCMHARRDVCIYICTCIYIYTYTYVCIYIYIYIYIYLYLYVSGVPWTLPLDPQERYWTTCRPSKCRPPQAGIVNNSSFQYVGWRRHAISLVTGEMWNDVIPVEIRLGLKVLCSY